MTQMKQYDVCHYYSSSVLIDYGSDCASSVLSYVNGLQFLNIKIPAIIHCRQSGNKLIVEQQLIQGKILPEFLRDEKNENCKIFSVFIKIIDDVLMLYSDNPRLRIDTNIHNFIVTDTESLYYVDIFPPIFLSNNHVVKFIRGRLEYDIAFQLVTFLYYFSKQMVTGEKSNKENLIVLIKNLAFELQNKLREKSIKIDIMNLFDIDSLYPIDGFFRDLLAYLNDTSNNAYYMHKVTNNSLTDAMKNE